MSSPMLFLRISLSYMYWCLTCICVCVRMSGLFQIESQKGMCSHVPLGIEPTIHGRTGRTLNIQANPPALICIVFNKGIEEVSNLLPRSHRALRKSLINAHKLSPCFMDRSLIDDQMMKNIGLLFFIVQRNIIVGQVSFDTIHVC